VPFKQSNNKATETPKIIYPVFRRKKSAITGNGN